MSEPRNSSNLKQYIAETEAEISKLKSRREEIQSELDKIQDDLSMLLDADEVQERISDLNSQRQMIDEGIEKRENRLQKLNDELQEANSAETKEKRIQACIKQAKKANQANQRYIDLMQSLDVELVGKIEEIANTRSQLATAANSFFNTLKLLEPAAERKHNDPSNDKELKEALQDMIDTIEERGNVKTATARSEQFNRAHYHRKTVRNIETPTVDNFGHWIKEMLNKHQSRQRRKAS